jgi:O-antigen/teichoic acid export membrane protein
MAVNSVAMAALQAYQRPRPFIMCSITGLFVAGLMSIYFVAFRGRGLEGVLAGQSVGVAIQLVLTLVVLSPTVRPILRARPLREMLAFCVPLVPTSMAAWVLNLADRYFLKAYDTLATVGLYALGFRFGTVLDTLFVRSFTQAWYPYLFSILDNPDHPAICARVLEYYTFGGGFIVLGMALYGGDVIRLISDSSFWGADGVIYWIALGCLLRGMTYITVAGIQVRRKTQYSAYVYGVGSALNVGLLWVLVPRFSIMGAALSMVLTYFAISVTLYLIAQRLHPIPYRVGKVLGVLLLMTAIYLPSRMLPAETTLATLAAKSVLLLLFPTLLVGFRFLAAEDIARARGLLGSWLPDAAR